ncbi:putative ankyrin repeat domain-containing protein 20A2 isoform X3 [Callithrix jacchus]
MSQWSAELCSQYRAEGHFKGGAVSLKHKPQQEKQGLRCSSRGSGQTDAQTWRSSTRGTVRDAVEVSRHRRIEKPGGKSIVGACHGLALRIFHKLCVDSRPEPDDDNLTVTTKCVPKKVSEPLPRPSSGKTIYGQCERRRAS